MANKLEKIISFSYSTLKEEKISKATEYHSFEKNLLNRPHSGAFWYVYPKVVQLAKIHHFWTLKYGSVEN